MEMSPELTQNLYVLEQLEKARRGIAQMREDMPACRSKIQKLLNSNKLTEAKDWHIFLCIQKEKLLEHLETCRLSLQELELYDLSDFTVKLARAVTGFSVMTPDYGKFSASIGHYLQQLPSRETITTNVSVLGRLMNHVRMGYYPTDLEHVKMMVNGIAFPPGITTNLLDPCCGCGSALRTLAMGNNCFTYGVELDQSRAEEAQSRLHRVAMGSFFYSRISHEAFHILFLNPPYLSVLGEGGTKARHEKRFLAEGLEKLVLGGLLIYIVPYYRITSDIARILCDNFEDLSVYRFTEKEFQRFKQVVVFGKRRPKGRGASLVSALMAACSNKDRIPLLTELPQGRYALPAVSTKVSVFKGTVFNQLELARQLAASNSIAKRLERNQLDSMQRRPLLPLNIGQVGLIGGSGLMNGLVSCDTPHIIKGRITKETLVEVVAVEKDKYGNQLRREESETVTNKLTFNILSPTGFQSLTQTQKTKGG